MNPEDMQGLVDAHGDAVYRFCLRLTGGRGEADELYQQTFLRALELARRIDRNRSPRGFLMALAAGIRRRSATKEVRRRRILPHADGDGEALMADVPGPADVEADAGRREARAAVRRRVRALPERLRTPLLMHYAGGLGVAEIADALGIRQGTVKSRLFDARRIVRKGLEADGYGQDG